MSQLNKITKVIKPPKFNMPNRPTIPTTWTTPYFYTTHRIWRKLRYKPKLVFLCRRHKLLVPAQQVPQLKIDRIAHNQKPAVDFDPLFTRTFK